MLAAACALPALAAGPKTRLVSKANNGDPAANGSDYSAISGAGNVAAFTSRSDNLPQGDGTTGQIYARDLDTDKTILVSRTSDGEAAEEFSSSPWLSSSGRFVSFQSTAANLPSGTGSFYLMYVHNLDTHNTRLVSKNSDGDAADAGVSSAGISGDGRYAAFTSPANNLPEAASIAYGLYVNDRETQKTRLVSKTSDGTAVDADDGQIASDGKHVVFSSSASALPGGDGSTNRVYSRDLGSGTTKLLSRNAQGDPADGNCGYAATSGDGSATAFTCEASNLPGGGVGHDLVYVRDLDAGTTRLASKESNGTAAEDSVYDPFISGNGRVVSFYTDSDNLPGPSGTYDVYTYDVGDGNVRVVSRNSAGEAASESSEAYPPCISRDGSYLVFRTNASNLPGGDDFHTQLYVRGPLD